MILTSEQSKATCTPLAFFKSLFVMQRKQMINDSVTEFLSLEKVLYCSHKCCLKTDVLVFCQISTRLLFCKRKIRCSSMLFIFELDWDSCFRSGNRLSLPFKPNQGNTTGTNQIGKTKLKSCCSVTVLYQALMCADVLLHWFIFNTDITEPIHHFISLIEVIQGDLYNEVHLRNVCVDKSCRCCL